MITLTGLRSIPEVKEGDNIGRLIVSAARNEHVQLNNGDIVVVAQKIVSKAEGRIVELSMVQPTPLADLLARRMGKDPRQVELTLREARSIIRATDLHLIVETHHGFICANAGIDASNIGPKDCVTLLPKAPDASAQKIRGEIRKLSHVDLAVIISDTFGRPWRAGQMNFAIGVAGINPLIDYRGTRDMFRRVLNVTMIAVADELASAAELEMNKADGVPVVIVKGYSIRSTKGKSKDLLRNAKDDLFR